VLIEDDVLVAQEMAEQLAMFGREVLVFNNATDAISGLADTIPPAVIVDLMLPEGELIGLEVIQQIQARSMITVPHVVISSRNDWVARLAAVRSGAAAYLVKPVDVSVLEELLERITHHSIHASYRVLLVDDDAMLAEHYVQVLTGAGMNVVAISTPSNLLMMMAEHRPEIVLMDLYMPECSGIEALKVIRQDPQYHCLPIVFMSTESGLTTQQAAMKTGAEDFLQKPVSDANLIMAVTIRAARFRELTTLIRQDSLTGLLNHISFKLQLEAEIERSRRSATSLVLAMLDIDLFKKVNDTYGHPQGDRVIKGLSQLLRKRLRKSDVIGRYGGEEFIVAMPETSLAQAVIILNELRESFGKLRFEVPYGEFTCTFSGGVAVATSAESAMSLINLADEALYQAKHLGRNRIELLMRYEQIESMRKP
jgi:diguanylate cyclase (GGDEF)-like protein